jgi:hypothetical protein
MAESKIQMLYDHIKSPGSGILTKPDGDGIYHVSFDRLMHEEGFRKLKLEEWMVLIHKLYFDGDDEDVTSIAIDFDNDAELSVELSKIFDYDEPLSFKELFRPASHTVVKKTPGRSRQGIEHSCFAHAATNMIIRNVYKISMTDPDTALYIKNNCNQYLDTTRPLENLASIEANCGVSSARRILLFRYIYRVITNEYGCNFGNIGYAVLYYLQAALKPVFPPAILEIMPDITTREPYTLSTVPMRDFNVRVYNPFLMDYFKEYYAVINTVKPSHSLTIVGIDEIHIHGKDSSTGEEFLIELDDFQHNGTFEIGGQEYSGISFIFFLFEPSKLATYPEVITAAIVRSRFGTPKDFPEPIDFPEYSDSKAAEDTKAAVEAAEGGKKSRKRKKSRRKRSRRRKN